MEGGVGQEDAQAGAPDSGDAEDAAPVADGAARFEGGGAICPGPNDQTCNVRTQSGFGLAYDTSDSNKKGPVRWSILERPAIQLERNEFRERNNTTFKVQTDQGIPGAIAFSVQAPDAVWPDSVPNTVRYHKGGGYTDCLWPAGGAGSREPVANGLTTLRTSGGELLYVGMGPLLREGGKAELPDIEELPFALTWVDAGCVPCDTHGTVMRTVAIQLTLKGESTPAVRALPGERKSFEMGGASYVFLVDESRVPVSAGFCGAASSLLYREDLVVELNEDGTRI